MQKDCRHTGEGQEVYWSEQKASVNWVLTQGPSSGERGTSQSDCSFQQTATMSSAQMKILKVLNHTGRALPTVNSGPGVPIGPVSWPVHEKDGEMQLVLVDEGTKCGPEG